MSESQALHKGLGGILADETAVSKVDTRIMKLLYRGYDINELCDKASFLEVAHLLLLGELPTVAELEAFEARERASRDIPEPLYDLYRSCRKDAHPMDLLRLGVTYLGLQDEDNALGDNPAEKNLRKALSVFAKIPVIIANSYRLVQGQDPIAPDRNLSYSENFLYMLLGESAVDAFASKVLDTSLILYAEHGFNASTFSSRVTASTLSDYYAAVSSAIGTLKGPLHGGANEKVMHLLKDIGEVGKAEAYVRDLLARKEKVMGFGHRLYRTGDSRSAVIQNLGLALAKRNGDMRWHDISEVVARIVIAEKGIYPNLDFPTAPAYYLLGIPIALYTPIFVASRVTGWSAHLFEQYADNRLIRPGCMYVGEGNRPVQVLEDRT